VALTNCSIRQSKVNRIAIVLLTVLKLNLTRCLIRYCVLALLISTHIPSFYKKNLANFKWKKRAVIEKKRKTEHALNAAVAANYLNMEAQIKHLKTH
jgi:hypothetical protein